MENYYGTGIKQVDIDRFVKRLANRNRVLGENKAWRVRNQLQRKREQRIEGEKMVEILFLFSEQYSTEQKLQVPHLLILVPGHMT